MSDLAFPWRILPEPTPRLNGMTAGRLLRPDKLLMLLKAEKPGHRLCIMQVRFREALPTFALELPSQIYNRQDTITIKSDIQQFPYSKYEKTYFFIELLASLLILLF